MPTAAPCAYAQAGSFFAIDHAKAAREHPVNLDDKALDGRRRVVIENVRPAVDDGRFAIKRTATQQITVTADVFADGHDAIRVVLLFREAREANWHECPMRALGNDAWEGEFTVEEVGAYEYTVQGWVDWFQSWQRDLKKRLEAQQDVSVDLLIGANLVAQAADRARGADANQLSTWQAVVAGKGDIAQRQRVAASDELAELVARYPDKRFATTYKAMPVTVDRERARFSAWYEMFPRSTSTQPGGHGTFKTCIERLPYVASMGFDVLYLPPIHPVGRAFRKGKNNALEAQPGEPGSPWAIGGPEGGHKAINPALGTLADFQELVQAARARDIDIALDVAFQCSPDHPYVKEHPSWFRQRPDGTVQYAENPPKKYQDIYPFDFETSDWRAMWAELKSIFTYWIEQGVYVFRVDNPHTKAFAFWEWAIGEIKSQYPETIFLSEAFTRPKVMYRLAKLGFSQSYTYFTWRNHKAEFIEYLTELTQTNLQEFFRPNLWPNTPDILPEHLQTGGRAAFVARLALAATLGASYGIYGPAFELMEHVPREHGSEEYLNSEKYEVRHWDLDRPDSLREVITRINRTRHENPCLKANLNLRFHDITNDHLLAYSKRSDEFDNTVLAVVNLDFHGSQSGWLTLPLEQLGLRADRPYQLRDVLSDATFTWQGARNYVDLNPAASPAHVFVVSQDKS